MGMLIRWTGAREWSAGMEHWNGVLEWTTGMEHWSVLLLLFLATN